MTRTRCGHGADMPKITDAMVKNYKVPADAVVITLVETPKTDKAKGGVMFADMAPR